MCTWSTNRKEGHLVVNVRMPVGIVTCGLKMAKVYAPEMKDKDTDWDSIGAMIDEGDLGKLVCGFVFGASGPSAT